MHLDGYIKLPQNTDIILCIFLPWLNFTHPCHNGSMGYGISHIPFFFRHNDARVYEKEWDIPEYPKKILPHQEAGFFR